MILAEALEDLVHNDLEDPAGPGSAAGKVNAQDLVGHIVHHLAEHRVTIGSRLAQTGTTPGPAAPHRCRLPLVFQENDDGHVRIYCDGCVWSWPLDTDASAQTNGDTITSAVEHSLRRHIHTS